MSSKDGMGYSIFRIWVILFSLTAAEVLWGMFLRPPTFPRWLLWGGLLAFAGVKGIYIFMYFMHMKYEKFIVWSMIIPTPFLMAVVICALYPDMANKDEWRDHPLGQMTVEGEVVDVFQFDHPPFGHHAVGGHGDDGHGGGGDDSHAADDGGAGDH